MNADFWLETITPPAFEPVEVKDARRQLRFDASDNSHDESLKLYIAAARQRWEQYTDRVLAQTSLRMTCLSPQQEVDLPGGKIISVDTIETRPDSDEAWEAADAADYDDQSLRIPPRLVFDTAPQQCRVAYTVGYATAADIPAEYKLTILQLVAFYFENPGDVQSEIPLGLMTLLRSQHAGTVAGYWTNLRQVEVA